MKADIASDKANSPDISDGRWSADDVLKYYSYLGIPHFQRGLVWGQDAVALLLESLYLETPCGALIFWRPREPSREGIILPGAEQVRYLILDGQQRIRSIHIALSETGEMGGSVEEGDEDEWDDRVWCLNLACVRELSAQDGDLRKYLKDQERYSLFRYIQHPDSPKARFKHNVIPLKLFFDDRDEKIESLIFAGGQTEYLARRILEMGLKEKVKRLRTKQLFSVHVLKEDTAKYNLADVVSLYNRINSGGKRVEAEEVAFASLVALAPGTGNWLANVFNKIHPPRSGASDGQAIRDEVLRRRKERNFGFKLIIRTFIQVCAYHFGYSLGSSALSFDVVDSPRFRADLIRASDKIDRLQSWTQEILSFVRGLLAGKLYCDDLQMLPDTMALLPAFQLLIRFPGLMKTTNGQEVVGSLILRLILQRRLNQRMALNLVDFINKHHTIRECILSLDKELGPTNLDDLRKGLKESNALLDRYTLLLYWLLRKNGATDFFYNQLPQDRRDAMRQKYQKELDITEKVKPEKQHIVPYKVLTSLYEIKARGRISRHIANNVGNITYLSHALNHFETGLGSDRARLEEEPKENLERHFLLDSARPGLLRDFLTVAEKAGGKKHQRIAFERFCKVRRDLIAKGFVDWVNNVRADANVNDRIEPEPRLYPVDEDRVRAMDFPDAVEDALIGCAMTGGIKFDEKKSAKRDEYVFNVRDKDRRIVFELWLCKEPPRIDVVPHKNPLYDQMCQWMNGSGDSLLKRPEIVDGKPTGHWMLSAEVNRSSGTIEVLIKLAECLGQHGGERNTTRSKQEFLDFIKEPQTKEIFNKLISFAEEVGYIHCATKSVSARIPFGEGGHLRVFRLINRGTVKVIPLAKQLKKYGIEDQIALDTTKQIEDIFPDVGLKSGTHELSRYLNASEIGDHLDQFVAVFKQVADRMRAILPTRIPLEEEEEPEEEDG